MTQVAGVVAERTVEAAPPGIGVACESTRSRSRAGVKLIVAIAAVWILWGSTFAAMRFAVGTMPPFVMASLRFFAAGAVLYAVCLVRGNARVTRAELTRALVTGVTLLLLGNGVTAWTVQYLPTGLNSLLLSVAPIWMALIGFAWGRERPSRLAIAGMVLGLAGLGLLLQPKTGSSIPLWPALLAVLASVSWSFGSIYQRRAGKPGSLVLSTALQMLAGGVLLGLEAAAFGQWQALDVHAISAVSLGGLLWLIVMGSIIAYSAYLYTMQAAQTALASTYAYVNPIVSVILGMLLFHERFSPTEALAGAVIIAGVALMMVPVRR